MSSAPACSLPDATLARAQTCHACMQEVPRHQSGVPSFLRIDFRDPSHLRESAGDGLVMRVDWCV